MFSQILSAKCPPSRFLSGICIFINASSTACPPGTYKPEGAPGGPGTCLPCPDAQHTSQPGSTSINDCVCRPGYQPAGPTCQSKWAFTNNNNKKPTITSLKKKKTVFAVPSESSSRACFAFLCHGRISQTASTVMAAAVRMFLTRLFRLATMAPNSQMSQKLQSATEDPV